MEAVQVYIEFWKRYKEGKRSVANGMWRLWIIRRETRYTYVSCGFISYYYVGIESSSVGDLLETDGRTNERL